MMQDIEYFYRVFKSQHVCPKMHTIMNMANFTDENYEFGECRIWQNVVTFMVASLNSFAIKLDIEQIEWLGLFGKTCHICHSHPI